MNQLDLQPQQTLDDMVHAIEEDGFLYLPNMLNREEVSLLRSRIDSVSADPEANDVDFGSKPHPSGKGPAPDFNKHIKVLFNRDALFLRYLDIEPVIDVAEAIMGEDCHAIGMTGWVTGPGRPDQALHVDYQPLEAQEELLMSRQVNVPVFIATAHFYLDDTTEDLGPTKFIPGSHRAGRSPLKGKDNSWRGRQPQSALCDAGDVVLFRSDVWHRGSANTTDRGRYLLQVHYGRKFVHRFYTPYKNFRFDPDILAQATPRQRRLMGDHPPGAYA